MTRRFTNSQWSKGIYNELAWSLEQQLQLEQKYPNHNLVVSDSSPHHHSFLKIVEQFLNSSQEKKVKFSSSLGV